MNDNPILLFGNGPYRNRGCEAIVRGTQRILARHFPNRPIKNYFFDSLEKGVTPTVRPDVRDGVDSQSIELTPPNARCSCRWIMSQVGRRLGPHDWAHVAFRDFRVSFRKYLDHACGAMQIGGDNFSLDYGYPLRYAAMNKELIDKNIPVVIWGASVGPFGPGTTDERWMIEHFRRCVAGIFVREKQSFEYLTHLGLGDRTILMGDPAFVMEAEKPCSDVWNDEFPSGAIGLNLSPILYRFTSRLGKTLCEWTMEAGRLIRALREEFDRPIVLIPHVSQSGNDDGAFMQEALGRAIRREHDVIVLDSKFTAAETKWFISRLDLLVAARTHATIAGFSSGVPTISIGYSRKAGGLNEWIFGDQSWMIAVDRLSSDSLTDMAHRALDESDAIKTTLHRRIPEIQKAAYDAGDALKRIFTVSA
jgi:colanic acid/amylovoran biosynthesis protein